MLSEIKTLKQLWLSLTGMFSNLRGKEVVTMSMVMTSSLSWRISETVMNAMLTS